MLGYVAESQSRETMTACAADLAGDSPTLTGVVLHHMAESRRASSPLPYRDSVKDHRLTRILGRVEPGLPTIVPSAAVTVVRDVQANA